MINAKIENVTKFKITQLRGHLHGSEPPSLEIRGREQAGKKRHHLAGPRVAQKSVMSIGTDGKTAQSKAGILAATGVVRTEHLDQRPELLGCVNRKRACLLDHGSAY